jgi:hypothetical protein
MRVQPFLFLFLLGCGSAVSQFGLSHLNGLGGRKGFFRNELCEREGCSFLGLWGCYLWAAVWVWSLPGLGTRGNDFTIAGWLASRGSAGQV